jgi:hypothetical protein
MEARLETAGRATGPYRPSAAARPAVTRGVIGQQAAAAVVVARARRPGRGRAEHARPRRRRERRGLEVDPDRGRQRPASAHAASRARRPHGAGGGPRALATGMEAGEGQPGRPRQRRQAPGGRPHLRPRARAHRPPCTARRHLSARTGTPGGHAKARRAGVVVRDCSQATEVGTAHGSPRSPWLAQVGWDDRDQGMPTTCWSWSQAGAPGSASRRAARAFGPRR